MLLCCQKNFAYRYFVLTFFLLTFLDVLVYNMIACITYYHFFNVWYLYKYIILIKNFCMFIAIGSISMNDQSDDEFDHDDLVESKVSIIWR